MTEVRILEEESILEGFIRFLGNVELEVPVRLPQGWV